MIESKRKSEAGTVPPRRRPSKEGAGPRGTMSQGRDRTEAGREPDRGDKERRRRRDETRREMT